MSESKACERYPDAEHRDEVSRETPGKWVVCFCKRWRKQSESKTSALHPWADLEGFRLYEAVRRVFNIPTDVPVKSVTLQAAEADLLYLDVKIKLDFGFMDKLRAELNAMAMEREVMKADVPDSVAVGKDNPKKE